MSRYKHLQACRLYLNHAPRDFITFEYCMLDGINDGPEHAQALIELMRHGAGLGVSAKFNLIPFNPFPASGLRRSPQARVLAFAQHLQDSAAGKPGALDFLKDALFPNERTWLDNAGNPHSADLTVTERYHMVNRDLMEFSVTIDDPKFYTKPFSVKINYTLVANNDIFEMFCGENEKDRAHMVKGPAF